MELKKSTDLYYIQDSTEFETMIDYVSQDIIKNHLFPSHCADKRANE